MCKITKKFKINKFLQCRTQVLLVHRDGVLCILLTVKLAPQADTGCDPEVLNLFPPVYPLPASQHKIYPPFFVYSLSL